MTDTPTTTADLLALPLDDFIAAMARLSPPPAMPSAPPMNSSASIVQLATALAQAQGAFPTIPRDRSVKVNLKSRDGQPGGSYTFKYAPLETILEKTRPHLAANGLALVQTIATETASGGGVIELLRTTLFHSSGEWLACDVPIFVGTGDNRSQAYASGVTYSRRYGVTMLLCVAADEDDDGNGGDQDGGRPDFERQGPQPRQQYQGRFPKQGGGHTQPRDQGQADAPRSPQRRSQAAQQPLDDLASPTGAVAAAVHGTLVDTGTGEVLSPYADGLTKGQLAMCVQRAEWAGLDDAGVLQLCGVITPENVGAALAKLKEAADQVQG